MADSPDRGHHSHTRLSSHLAWPLTIHSHRVSLVTSHGLMSPCFHAWAAPPTWLRDHWFWCLSKVIMLVSMRGLHFGHNAIFHADHHNDQTTTARRATPSPTPPCIGCPCNPDWLVIVAYARRAGRTASSRPPYSRLPITIYATSKIELRDYLAQVGGLFAMYKCDGSRLVARYVC